MTTPASVRWFVSVLLALLSSATTSSLRAQVWQVDPSFAPQLLNDVPVGGGTTLVALADGSLLAHGDFTHVGSTAADGLALLRADGSPAPNFATRFARSIVRLAPLPDGRFMAISTNRPPTSATPARLERYLANGMLDETYPAISLSSSLGYDVSHLVPLPDGRMMVSGWFSALGTLVRSSLARLNRDGSLDPTFDAGPLRLLFTPVSGALVAQLDGKILLTVQTITSSPTSSQVVTTLRLARLQADGLPDPTFAPLATTSAVYHALAVQTDGKILAATGSSFTRFLANGAIDPTFAPSIPGFRRVDQIVALANGKILVQARVSPVPAPAPTATAPTYDSDKPSAVFVLAANGALERDLRSGLPAEVAVELVTATADGRAIVRYGYPVTTYQYSFEYVSPPIATLSQPVFARFDSAATRDPAFAPLFTRRDPAYVNRLAGDAAGRLFASGAFTSVNGQPRPGLARFQPDGSLDPAYTPAAASRLLFALPDGKLLVHESTRGGKNADGVFSTGTRFVRLLADGTRDPGFDSAGLPSGGTLHAIEADGRLLASGYLPDATREENYKLIRLNSDGSRSTVLATTLQRFVFPFIGFDGQSGPADPTPVLLPLPDGKFLIKAAVWTLNGTAFPGLARLNPDGTTDATYRPAISWETGAPFGSLSLQFLRSGRVLFRDSRPQSTWGRLLANGDPDPSFAPLADSFFSTVVEQADGKLLSASGAQRFLANGLPDLNYTASRTASAVSSPGYASLPLELGGRIYLGGQFTAVNGHPRSGLARLAPDSPVLGFTAQPHDQTIVAGREVTFQGALGTDAATTWQWTLNGSTLPGATSSALVLRGIRPAQAGLYRLVGTTGGQTFFSAPARLTVPLSRLTNFSARSRLSATRLPQIAGFVLDRHTAVRPLLLRAIGRDLPGLRDVALPTPVLRVYERSSLIAENRGGAIETEIRFVAEQVGAFPVAQVYVGPGWVSANSALYLSFLAGAYTAQVTSGDGASGVCLVELYDASTSPTPFLRNGSFRGRTAPGADVLTLGFVIAGEGPLRLLLRGIGPTLARYGVAGALADPQLTLFGPAGLVATNDNWDGDSASTARIIDATTRTGAFPLPAASKDAALLLSLEPGAYTLQLTGAGGASGEVLAEIYIHDTN